MVFVLLSKLEEFRQQWQDELQNRPGSGRSSPYPSQGAKREEKVKCTQKEIDLEEEVSACQKTTVA